MDNLYYKRGFVKKIEKPKLEKRTSILLSKERRSALRLMAAKLDITSAELARKFVEEGLEKLAL